MGDNSFITKNGSERKPGSTSFAGGTSMLARADERRSGFAHPPRRERHQRADLQQQRGGAQLWNVPQDERERALLDGPAREIRQDASPLLERADLHVLAWGEAGLLLREAERVLERAEPIDQVPLERLRTRPHPAAGERLDGFPGQVSPLRDAREE